MQEDKTTKWLAASLRKQQEEDPLPYELGAWEAFEKRRAAIARKKSTYWITGVAASIAILLVAGGLWLSQDTDSTTGNFASQLAQEGAPISSTIEEQESQSILTPDTGIASDRNTGSNQIPGLSSSEKAKTEGRQPNLISKSFDQATSKPNSMPSESKMNENLAQNEIWNTDKSASSRTDLIASLPETQGKTGEVSISKTETPEKVIAIVELPKEPQMSEEEIKEILETKSSTRIAMGLSPSFGTSQGTEQTTSGSSLGLGVMVDMDITGKLVMGSGLAVNYLNQASESQSYAQVAGFSSPVTETNKISQVQVDIPLYFKYPITRNQSISVQAGFSNLLTFNQEAEQQSSYTRQIAVNDGSASNSFTLKSESVNQAQALSVPNQKFYPFATANLGVNIQLYESKKTSYEVMPFYNYPLQEFSGYGEKLGMFGASFKVNFGAIQKK